MLGIGFRGHRLGSRRVGQIAHDSEHYGNLVTYFRLKGMVPPSSKRQ